MRFGFTLIELSIVLVIIGLVAGGVLVGRDLIKASEVRATVAQLEKYKTAVNTFRSKYSCLPGDCANAESFELGVHDGIGENGDGNGIVNGLMVIHSAKEAYNFWYHLSRAGLVDGNFPGVVDVFSGGVQQDPTLPGVDIPMTKLGRGGFWLSDSMWTQYQDLSTDFTYNTANNFWIVGKVTGQLGGIGTYYYGALTPYENFAIDAKADDGVPTAGNITLSMPYNHYNWLDLWIFKGTGNTMYGPPGANTPYCGTNTTPPRYNVQNNSGADSTLCILQIRAGF